jgi:hypothetical protein
MPLAEPETALPATTARLATPRPTRSESRGHELSRAAPRFFNPYTKAQRFTSAVISSAKKPDWIAGRKSRVPRLRFVIRKADGEPPLE